ncbi:MAG TPA: diguanylate cyclase [Candidatus Omnitrophota bacterium]|nr:diguanylate cyclase [Candidatus Omnitrophota bacterium]HPT07415.1 diguanylate cyclase [Candidatus Omnitrophota bacterium]
MKDASLRILILEDNPDDVALIRIELQKASIDFVDRCVQTREDFLRQLNEFKPDLILADYTLPDFNGIAALVLAKTYSPDTPFIFVTGSMNEETAVDCLKSGASDYVIKEHLVKLPSAIDHALHQRDIVREREKILVALRESRRMLSTLMSNLPGMAYRCKNDPDWTMEFVSEGCFELTGYNPADLIGNTKVAYAKLIHPDDRPHIWDAVQIALQAGKSFTLTYRIISAAGVERWVWEQGRGVFSQTGELMAIEGFVLDITDRKHSEEQLEILTRDIIQTNKRLKQLALRDQQTGLFNHRYLTEVIEGEFDRARRYGNPLSAIMMDIDYFKSINDVYGHLFGDLVLTQFASQLKRLVRQYDIVIRYGGEEFLIISPGIDREHAIILARRLQDAVNPYNFGNKKHSVKLKLSIGVASFPEDKIGRGMELIEFTERVLGRVKESGGNRVFSSLDVKRERPEEIKANVSDNVVNLREKIEKLNKRANRNLAEAIFAFARTIELKDHYTGTHVEQTVHIATELAKALNIPKYETELIRQASMLHDFGKIGVPEKILLKKGKLTPQEYAEIKKHPKIAADILRPIHIFHALIPIIVAHHERWDGKGYPDGLKGEEIPLGARIVAIADVYQALISRRPYHKAYSKAKATEIIREGRGTQFDPHIVDVFLKILAAKKL